MRKSDDKGSEPFEIEDCTIKHVTAKAVLVVSEELASDQLWIPKSVFHDESEVDPHECEKGDEGTVVVQMWWAMAEELTDGEED